MKLFKRIYYPIIAALLIFMLTLGFVQSSSAGFSKARDAGFIQNVKAHVDEIAQTPYNAYNRLNQDKVRDYILKTLTTGLHIRRDDTGSINTDGNNNANIVKDGKSILPTVNVQKATVRQESIKAAGATEVIAVDKAVQNIVVVVPGTKSKAEDSSNKGDAVLLTAHYDVSAMGGASDLVAVSAMIENALDAAKSYDGANDLIFLFTDAANDGAYGLAAFMYQFAGFGNITSRIKLAANFDAGSNGGVVMLYESSDNNSNLILEYAKINGGKFASSAVEVLSSSYNQKVSDFDAMGGVAALNFKNVVGSSNYATSRDTVENLSKSFIQQQSDAMFKFYEHFGDVELDTLSAKSNAVYFSYLGLGTIAYPSFVAYIIAALILILLISIIILNRKRKVLNWAKIGGGIFVQLLTLLATALTLFITYFLITLLLSAFGIITVHSLSSIIFTSPALMIAAMLFTIAIGAAFFIIFKKTFAVNAVSVVRGNTLIWTAAAIILSFAMPAISYLFAIVALLSLVVMLVTVLTKQCFKAKFSMDIERLFLYVWPVILVLPLFVTLFMVIGSFVSALSLPIFMAIFLCLSACMLPYFDYLKPVLDSVVKKLPKRSIRYERLVTEKVEDKAKKGKFTEVTSKKIFVEKIEWTYLNRVGIAIISVISIVLLVIFGSVGKTFSSSVTGTPAYSQAIYDDSMLFVWEKSSDGVTNATIDIYDQMAYEYMNLALSTEKRNNFKWNDERKAYSKNFSGSVSSFMPTTPDFTKDGNVITFKPYDSAHSFITVSLSGAENVTSITFNKGDDNRESEEYSFTNQEKIVFTLPYGYEAFTMNIDASCEVTFEQHVYNSQNLQFNGSDWEFINNYYEANDTDILSQFKSGMVLRVTKNL